MLCEVIPVGLLGSNCIIVGDEQIKEALVIDPGGDAPSILMQLAKRELKVIGIVHTHGHVDHVGATGELARVTGAPTYLHEADRFLFDTVGRQAAMFGLPAPESAKVDHTIDDGDTIAVGGHSLHTMHTPGHSPGSVSFLVDDKSVVICGDTLFAGGIGRTDIWGGDFETLARSIRERLYTLDGATEVIPGHGPKTTIERERMHNPFVRA
ncbi:MBL fold metallo-hydrolase [Myxococcota bacterium]